MERTELTRLKSLFGSNLLGPDELQPLVSRWGKATGRRGLLGNLAHCAPSDAVSHWGLAHCAPSNGEAEDCAQGPVPSETPRLEIPPLNYSWADLESHAKDYILVMGQSSIHGVNVTLRQLRSIFGIDPEQQEPCFYNQDWYLNETFLDTKLENRWYLLKKDVFESSRAELPDKLSKEISFPSAVLCAYTFFAYYLYYKQPLWYHDFVWCCDLDHNGDRIYVGKYHDIDGVNKNGFSVHRHLALRPCYAAVDAL